VIVAAGPSLVTDHLAEMALDVEYDHEIPAGGGRIVPVLNSTGNRSLLCAAECDATACGVTER
jgi:hypothetical protein